MYNFGPQGQPPAYNQFDFQRYQAQRYQEQNALIRVTGIEGARAYQMQPNSTAALFDNNDDYFYVKTTDGAGFPTIRTFRFEEITNERKQEASSEYASKDELQKLREEVMSYVQQSIQAKQPQQQTKQTGTTDGAS